MTIWPTGYEYAHIAVLLSGVLLSVASEADSDPGKIWFRKSNDGGVTWSTPVLVGTLASGLMAQIHTTSRGRLIVTNGVDTTWESLDGGRTWSAL